MTLVLARAGSLPNTVCSHPPIPIKDLPERVKPSSSYVPGETNIASPASEAEIAAPIVKKGNPASFLTPVPSLPFLDTYLYFQLLQNLHHRQEY